MIEVVWSDLGEPFFGCGLRAYLETEQNGRRCLCGQAAWVPASVLLASRRVLLTSLRSTSTLTMCPCLLCGGALLLRCIAAVVQYFCAAQCAVLLWVSTFVLLSVQCCCGQYLCAAQCALLLWVSTFVLLSVHCCCGSVLLCYSVCSAAVGQYFCAAQCTVLLRYVRSLPCQSNGIVY